MTDTTAIAQEQIAYWLEAHTDTVEAMTALGYPTWFKPNWNDVLCVLENKIYSMGWL